MKKYIIPLIIVLLTFNSCKKIDELTQFKMVFDEPIRDVVILPLMVGEEIPYEFTTASNSESQFQKNKTAIDLVEEIILEKVSLSINTDSSVDFSFLESIKFYMQAEGRDDLLIASKTGIDATVGQELILDVIDQDLSFYLKQEELELKVEILAKEAVSEPFDIMIHMEFHVDAKILGV